jgi:hypothetical protein
MISAILGEMPGPSIFCNDLSHGGTLRICPCAISLKTHHLALSRGVPRSRRIEAQNQDQKFEYQKSLLHDPEDQRSKPQNQKPKTQIIKHPPVTTRSVASIAQDCVNGQYSLFVLQYRVQIEVVIAIYLFL